MFRLRYLDDLKGLPSAAKLKPYVVYMHPALRKLMRVGRLMCDCMEKEVVHDGRRPRA